MKGEHQQRPHASECIGGYPLQVGVFDLESSHIDGHESPGRQSFELGVHELEIGDGVVLEPGSKGDVNRLEAAYPAAVDSRDVRHGRALARPQSRVRRAHEIVVGRPSLQVVFGHLSLHEDEGGEEEYL